MPRSFVTAAWLFATLGCQPEGGADAGFALLDGLDVIEVGAAGDAPILPWRLSETPSVRVGGDGRGEHHQYVEVSAATILRDGRVMVTDARTGLVRLYGPAGDFRGQLGSRGEGPGEFQSPSSLLWVQGDSIWIWDHTLWRTSVFSPQGAFVRSERYDPTAAGLYPVQGMWPAVVQLSGEGSLLIHLRSKGKAKVPGGDDLDRVGLAVHRYGAAKLDLIGLLPREEQAEVEAPWGATTLTPPLAAGPRITLSREEDWACVGHQSVPELLCVSATGHRVGLRWSSQPRSVWPGDPAIARWRDETGRLYSGKMSDREVRAMVAAVPAPRLYPAFRDLMFDALGYLWVGLGPTSQGPSESEYLIFGPELRLEGRLTLPTMTVIEIGADYVMGIRRDTIGVEEVVVFPLSRSAGRESG